MLVYYGNALYEDELYKKAEVCLHFFLFTCLKNNRKGSF